MSTISASTTSTTAYKVAADTTGTLVLQTGATPTTALTLGTDQSATFAGAVNAPNTFGFKNRIINGAMMIDQRNAGASVTPTANAYTLDRWVAEMTQASKYSVQQVASGAVGFPLCLKVTSTSAYSVVSTDAFDLSQRIEASNLSDLGWGGANAVSVTLSFWVYCSLTGTFGGSLRNSNNNRSYPFTYTISSANTWTNISITVAGDTSGTWTNTGNTSGMSVQFGLGVGSTYSGTAGSWASANYLSATGATSVVGTSGAIFAITGVQLEKGSTATSFDYRPYGTEFQLCQRYYQTIGEVFANGAAANSGNSGCFWAFGVQMRATPTITYTAEFGTVSATYPDPTKCTFSGTSSASNQFAVLYAKAAAEL